MPSSRGFTLIELLLVIAVVAVISVGVLLTLNPIELFRQARDSNRMVNLASLNKAVSIFEVDVSGGSFGAASTTYVSIADPAATSTNHTYCAGMGLPSLPAGWTYRCPASSTLRRVDGTGWVPVNLTLISGGSPISALPVDPVNATTSGNYYTYTPGGSWEFTASLEASKNKLGGSADKVSRDGGDALSLYEIGTNINLNPVDYGDSSLIGWWKFEEGSGGTALDSSPGQNAGVWNGTGGTRYGTGKVGAHAGRFNGIDDYVNVSSSILNVGAVTVMAWVKPDDRTSPVNQGMAGKGGSYRLMLSSANVGFTANTGANYDFFSAIPNNEWRHVAGTYSSADGILYVDGAVADTTSGLGGPGSGSLSINTNNFRIGFAYDYGYFPGRIDEVRIYNRVLSAAEIQAIYNATR